jgi:hypothetical protein
MKLELLRKRWAVREGACSEARDISDLDENNCGTEFSRSYEIHEPGSQETRLPLIDGTLPFFSSKVNPGNRRNQCVTAKANLATTALFTVSALMPPPLSGWFV